MAINRNNLHLNYNFDPRDYDLSHFSVLRMGTSGADTMRGGAGRDTFNGGRGNDTFIGNGGVDTFNGGEGTDTVDYSNAVEHEANVAGRTGVIVDLASNWGGEMGEASDTFSSIENLTGSNFNDGLFGDANVNVIRGLDGDDNIMGGAGGDTLDGGQGSDTLFYTTSNTGVTINLQTNTASGGHATGDVISGFENVSGSELNDTLRGNAGDNIIQGDGGRDTLDGAGGLNDTVSYEASNSGVTINLATNFANGGDATGDIISNFENITGSRTGDTLTGSALANTIAGLGGDDIMTGGAGRDTFTFDISEITGHDHITDFNVFDDVLQFDADGQPVGFTVETVDSSHVNMIINLENGDTLTLDNMDAGQATLMILFGTGVEMV